MLFVIIDTIIHAIGYVVSALCLAGALTVLFCFIDNHRRCTRGQRQEQLATHIEPVQVQQPVERHTEAIPAYIKQLDCLDLLGKEG